MDLDKLKIILRKQKHIQCEMAETENEINELESIIENKKSYYKLLNNELKVSIIEVNDLMELAAKESKE